MFFEPFNNYTDSTVFDYAEVFKVKFNIALGSVYLFYG